MFTNFVDDIFGNVIFNDIFGNVIFDNIFSSLTIFSAFLKVNFFFNNSIAFLIQICSLSVTGSALIISILSVNISEIFTHKECISCCFSIREDTSALQSTSLLNKRYAMYFTVSRCILG